MHLCASSLELRLLTGFNERKLNVAGEWYPSVSGSEGLSEWHRDESAAQDVSQPSLLAVAQPVGARRVRLLILPRRQIPGYSSVGQRREAVRRRKLIFHLSTKAFYRKIKPRTKISLFHDRTSRQEVADMSRTKNAVVFILSYGHQGVDLLHNSQVPLLATPGERDKNFGCPFVKMVMIYRGLAL